MHLTHCSHRIRRAAARVFILLIVCVLGQAAMAQPLGDGSAPAQAAAPAQLAAATTTTVYASRGDIMTYHRKGCRRLNEPTTLTRDEALRRGLVPCADCRAAAPSTPAAAPAARTAAAPTTTATVAATTATTATLPRAAAPRIAQQQVAPIAAGETVVYVTRTGKKYHAATCEHLAKSKFSVPLSRARAEYGPCSQCNPPR